MTIKIKFFVIAALFVLNFSTIQINAQTTLAAGDIAFSGYISANGGAGVDEFSFVLLKNIAAGTVINFTNNGWLHTGAGFRTGQQNIVWTATSALSAGQEVRITGLTAALAAGAGSPGTVTGTALNLPSSGDQVLAFQGTIASPTFISGIHMNVYSTVGNLDPVDTTAAAWDGTNSDTFNGSSLPPGLITGTNAIWVGTFQTPSSEFDNARFTCGSASISTIANIRASLNNPANWTKSNNTPVGFTLPTGCGYLVPTAAGAAISGRVTTAGGRGISRAYITLTDGSGEIHYAQSNAFGYYHFDGLAAGATYVLQISSKRHQFAQPTQVISVSENLSGIDFIAFP